MCTPSVEKSGVWLVCKAVLNFRPEDEEKKTIKKRSVPRHRREGDNRCKSINGIIRPLGYARVYLPLCKVADTPFHICGETW